MSSAIYWLVIRAYAAVLRLAALFNPKAKLFVAGRKDLLRKIKYDLINERRPRIWMHCASLGEFEQGRPVLEKLRKQYPHFAIVLTFFSPSGYEVRKDYDGADYIYYLPVDSVYNAKRFIKAVQPRLCIFVKYEFWYFYLAELAKKNIPTILVSAIFRPNQPFFKWYGRLHRRMLNCFSHIFVQNSESELLLNRIGIEDVTVAGDTRFDRVVEAVMQNVNLPVADVFSNGSKIIVAGSTWAGDEQFLLTAMSQLPLHWKLILVPHEVDEKHITEIEKLFRDHYCKWSTWTGADKDKRILVVDKVGLLMQLYSHADIAWIGGGFEHAGVHNVLEAAVYGVPVAFGPVYHQFAEAIELLKTPGAVSVDKPAAFASFVQQLEDDAYSYKKACEAAANYVQAHAGATRNILAYLSEKNLLNMP